MASFHTKTFTKHYNYMTPKHAWSAIQHFLPKDKVIWEAFAGNGNSSQYLRELGFEVICKEEDFFESNHGDIIVTNPPFSLKKECLELFFKLDKPFIMLCPIDILVREYMNKYFDKLQFIVPKKRYNFYKKNHKKSSSWFDTFFICYGLDLKEKIIKL